MIRPDFKTLEGAEHKTLWEKDERELYSDDPFDYYVNQYRNRIRKVVGEVLAYKPRRVLEVGCAQSNLSLMLAENGCESIAMDINFNHLTFSRLKYQQGKIHWVRGEGNHLPFAAGQFDCIILAEILEHCAYPENLLAEAKRVLSDKGICIVTTPNNDSVLCDLKSFSNVEGDRSEIEKFQFGPDGDDHLFTFSPRELKQVVGRSGFQLLKAWTINHHFLMWKRLYHLRRIFPYFWNTVLERLVPRIPYLGTHYAHCLFFVLRKEARA